MQATAFRCCAERYGSGLKANLRASAPSRRTYPLSQRLGRALHALHGRGHGEFLSRARQAQASLSNAVEFHHQL